MIVKATGTFECKDPTEFIREYGEVLSMPINEIGYADGGKNNAIIPVIITNAESFYQVVSGAFQSFVAARDAFGGELIKFECEKMEDTPMK